MVQHCFIIQAKANEMPGARISDSKLLAHYHREPSCKTAEEEFHSIQRSKNFFFFLFSQFSGIPRPESFRSKKIDKNRGKHLAQPSLATSVASLYSHRTRPNLSFTLFLARPDRGASFHPVNLFHHHLLVALSAPPPS